VYTKRDVFAHPTWPQSQGQSRVSRGKVSDKTSVQSRGGWKREHQMMLSELHVFEAHALKAGLLTQADLAAASPSIPGKSKGQAVRPGSGGTAQGRRDAAAEAQAATIRRQKLHELAIAGGIFSRSTKITKKDHKFMDDVDKVLAKTVAKVEKALETEVCLLPCKADVYASFACEICESSQ
jgi:hypothetical protein